MAVRLAAGGYAVLKRKCHPELLDLIRRSIELRPTRRFRDANEMLLAFRRIKRKSLQYAVARALKR